MRTKNLQSGKAFALIGILVILIFLSLIGAALINFVFNLSNSSNLEIDSTKALYLAEAGINYAIKELKTDIDLDNAGFGNAPMTKLGDGFFMVKHNPELFTLTATGIANRVRRSIEVNYSSMGIVE